MNRLRVPFDPARLPPAVLLRLGISFCAIVGAYDVLTITLFLSGGPLIGPPRWTLFPDFLVFHAGSRAALEGHAATVYGFESFVQFFNAVFRDRLPEYVGFRPYLYPPQWLLLTLPLALVPVAASFGFFMVLTAGFATCFVGPRHWIAWLAALTSPAALWTMVSGQNTFLNVALFYGGFRSVIDRRPVFGGFLLGLISYKPQLWVLVPVILLAGRQWRALASSLATAALLVILSAVVFGVEIWRIYLDFAREAASEHMIAKMFAVVGDYMTTFLAAAQFLGIPSLPAQAIHIFFALGALACAWTAARRSPWTDTHIAVFAAATLLISPYNIVYDMLLVMPAAAMLFQRRALEGFLPGEPLFYLGLWLIPSLLTRFNQHHLPVAPVLIASLVGLAWMSVRGAKNSPPGRAVQPQAPAPQR